MMDNNLRVQRVRLIRGNITDFERLVDAFNSSPPVPRQGARIILTRDRRLSARHRFATAVLYSPNVDGVMIEIMAIAFSTGNTGLEVCYDKREIELLEEPWYCFKDLIGQAGIAGATTPGPDGYSLETVERERIGSLLWTVRQAEKERQFERRRQEIKLHMTALRQESAGIADLCSRLTVDDVHTAAALALEEFDPARLHITCERLGHLVKYEFVAPHGNKVYGRYTIAPAASGGASPRMTWFADGDDTDALYCYVMSLIHSQIMTVASSSNQGAAAASGGGLAPAWDNTVLGDAKIREVARRAEIAGQYGILQKTVPIWEDIAKYKRLGLTHAQTCELLGMVESTFHSAWQKMKATGYLRDMGIDDGA